MPELANFSGLAQPSGWACPRLVVIPESRAERALPGAFWGLATTPFGVCHLGWCDRGIFHLAFLESFAEGDTVPLRGGRWQPLPPRDDAAALTLAHKIFGQTGPENTRFEVCLSGSAFQINVWRALCDIPVGQVARYGEIAAAIGAPRAARAVGAACGANPVAYLVPCHRVIGQSGQLTGYRWGIETKRRLLAWEISEKSAAAGMGNSHSNQGKP